MCADCYDYRAAVLFNTVAGQLWRRFTTYLPRHLARLGGTTQKEFRELVRVRFVKVAEYQARGVVHFHALVRLDATADGYQPPDPEWTTDFLCEAITAAAAQATALAPVPGTGRGLLLRFGPQTDTRPLHGHQGARSPATPSRTTSPSTPPRPPTPPACPHPGSAVFTRFAPCAARPTSSG